MSDYTPTTEEVRDAFCEAYPNHLSGLKSKEFNQWLAEVKAQAWDEGYVSSDDYYGNSVNPYREEEQS
jgi:hypothetical protein